MRKKGNCLTKFTQYFHEVCRFKHITILHKLGVNLYQLKFLYFEDARLLVNHSILICRSPYCYEPITSVAKKTFFLNCVFFIKQ